MEYSRDAAWAKSRCVVIGDRLWGCYKLAEEIANRLLAPYGPNLVIVHGGAPGVDQSFAVACRELGIDVEAHVADWKGLGNIAGPARNRQMVDAGADLCVALHRTLATSKGTKDCVRQALAARIPTYAYCEVDPTIDAGKNYLTSFDRKPRSWIE